MRSIIPDQENIMASPDISLEDPVVRPARAQDSAAVRALLSAASLPLEGVEERFPEGYAIAVVAEGRGPMGVAGLEVHGGSGLLRSVAVDPRWRGRGVGAALTRDRIEAAEAQGLTALYALTTTAPDYFSRLGFEIVERSEAPAEIRASHEFSAVCPTSATVLRLHLSENAAPGDLGAAVRARYGAAARRAASGGGRGCETSCCCGEARNPITSDLYANDELRGLPEGAALASLGCGNPTALADLHPGEVVLDLGSGGGIDVLLSARRVGPTGKAYGLDMTEEMLQLARQNARRAGAGNVEFLRGEIESIPLPDASVDVIISNCVINLSGDKARVLREAFRVLRPGGRFAVSDVVVRGEVPVELRRSMELWVGCVAGALEEKEFERLLRESGFAEIEIEPTRVYRVEDAREFLAQAGIGPEATRELDGRFASAFVRARKPHG
jgi:arsenite methyltransferase